MAMAVAAVLCLVGPGAGAGEAGTVRGLVVDEEGRPLAGARVRALRVSSYEPPDPLAPTLDVRTTATGRFEATLRAGDYVAVVTKGPRTLDFPAWRARRWEVAAGATLELRVPLRRGRRVEGQVVRKDDGRPVASAAVVVESGQATRTDERGQFVFEGVGRDAGELKVTAPGLADAYVERRSTMQGPSGLRVEMAPGFVLRGRVTDEAGRPVASARVARQARHRAGRVCTSNCATDADGRYELGGFARDGAPSEVVVVHPGFATSRATVSPRGAAGTLDVRVTQGFAVAGVVLGPEGRPVAGAEVSWESRWSRDPHHHTRTGAKGRFRLERLSGDSESRVHVHAGGCVGTCQTARPGRGGAEPKLTFRLARGRVARGRVLSNGDGPIGGAMVLVLVPVPDT